MDKTFSITF